MDRAQGHLGLTTRALSLRHSSSGRRPSSRLAQTHWKWVTGYHKIAVRMVMRSAHQVGQYTNRVFGRCATCGCWVSRASWLVRSWGLRYAEDRDYPALAGDLDLGDEHLDQGLPLAMAPGRDDAGDVIGDLPRAGSGGDRASHSRPAS